MKSNINQQDIMSYGELLDELIKEKEKNEFIKKQEEIMSRHEMGKHINSLTNRLNKVYILVEEWEDCNCGDLHCKHQEYAEQLKSVLDYWTKD